MIFWDSTAINPAFVVSVDRYGDEINKYKLMLSIAGKTPLIREFDSEVARDALADAIIREVDSNNGVRWLL